MPTCIPATSSSCADARYLAVDFGIMGTLSPGDQRYLAENFLAFFRRDYRRVAELHVESEWVPASTRVDEFESAIRTVCEPIFERPLKDISFGNLLLRLFQTARRFNMEVQPQLVLLQKTLLNIEGLGRQYGNTDGFFLVHTVDRIRVAAGLDVDTDIDDMRLNAEGASAHI